MLTRMNLEDLKYAVYYVFCDLLVANSYVRIFCVVTFYWFVSITMVFMNKSLLSGHDLDAPFFVTWFV